jgi:TonB-dependent SusC/RagA subfamily outer membrane receptor
MKRTFLWLFGLLMTVQVMAQNRTITGVVTDASNGEALIGVSVSGKGTSIGTVTDFDGVYSLSVPKDVTTLVFSYVGYTSVERPVTALKMDVKMASEATQIDEVVVSAYGTNRNKGEVSYANSKVTSDELTTSGSQGALSALQGKVAGVKISKSGGNINSSTRVVVRGETSFSGNNNALVVVDGVIVNNSSFSGGDGNGGSNVDYGNRGNDINPDDIESITLLKGPAATTIYGSAGNGGVLVITTKSGKAAAAAGKKFKVGYNTSFTVESPYILMQRQDVFGQGLWIEWRW